jgi:hypothetical protein
MEPLIIGVTGRARNGKTTIRDLLTHYLTEHYQVQVHHLSFADPIKDFLSDLAGSTMPFRGTDEQRNAPITNLWWANMSVPVQRYVHTTYGEGWIATHPHPTGRELMQIFGSEVIRDGFMQDTWVRMTVNRAKRFEGICVIDDVRFPDEARPISRGGFLNRLIKVNRPGIPQLTHASEVAVDQIPIDWCDLVVSNHSTIAGMSPVIENWVHSLLGVPTFAKDPNA